VTILQSGAIASTGGGYQIERSLRFNSADTAYLSRTPASASNRKTFTWSGWVKRSALSSSTRYFLFAAGSFASSTNTSLAILNDSINIYWGGTGGPQWTTTAVLRDPSAWYHIVYALDTTQATFGNRLKIYINGVELTAWSLQETGGLTAQNSDLYINNNQQHNLGASGTPGNYFDGYMTEVNFVDSPVLVGSTTNASTTVTLTTGTTTNIGIGWNVGGTNIPSGATVSSITNSTQFVISSAATATGSSISIGIAPPVTAFGETDSNTGVWKPKAFSGAYGTNGFYLKFADNSATTSTTLGKDSSGNGNNWTPNLFSVTAGTGNDSLVDSPTSYGTDTGVGGEVRGNYATLNPVVPSSGRTSLSNGNLQALGTSSVESGCNYGTIGVSSGKWYWECTVLAVSSASSYPNFGAVRVFSSAAGQSIGSSVTGGAGIFTGGTVYKEGSLVTTVSSYTTNDVIGIALDVDSLTCAFYKNGTLLTTVTGLTAGTYWPGIASYYNSSTALNTGQRPFEKWNGSAFVANTAPSGFKALCTQNLTTPTIGATSTTQANDYMNAVLWTGNASSPRAITGVGFQPDLLWIKSRNNAYDNLLMDAVRGTGNLKWISSNLTDAQGTNFNNANVTSLDSDGFTIGTTGGTNILNASGVTNVAWNWKANGAGSTNSNGTAKSSSVTVNSGTDTVTWNSHGMSDGQKIGFFAATMPGGLSAGTLYYVRDAATNTFKVAASSGGAAIDITSNGTTVTAHTTLTSTVSANTTAGFSIVTHINSGAPATIEHGLGVAPKFIINKVYDRTENWRVYYGTSNKLLVLNLTSAGATDANVWNNTNPTSNVFSIGTYFSSGDDVISYCFADVEGYSKAFSYASNNTSDNAFVYLGFRPRWIMIKSESAGGTNLDWVIYDTARMTYNYIANTELRANLTTTEGGLARNPPIDILSNGFKVRGSGGEIGSSTLYVGMAFAETPFKYSLAR
jgi:hypothetical protein